MKKELFVSILSASFILSVLTVPVFSEKISAKNNVKPANKYQKFLGQKKATGLDYSAQSTAGVEGVGKAGLKAKNHDKKVDDLKKDLYGGKPVNVVKKVINPKKTK